MTTSVTVPTAWHQLTPPQAAFAIELTEKYVQGQITLWQLKLLLLFFIVDYMPSHQQHSKADEEQISANLSLMAEQLSFLFKPHYGNPELLEVLSDDLQHALKTRFPHEITEPDWATQLDMIRSMIDCTAQLNLDIRQNIVTNIQVGDQTFFGPVFDIDALGVVTTDMLAAEYVDAYEYFNLYRSTKVQNYLDTFIAILYRTDRSTYNTFKAQRNGQQFKDVDMGTKKVVLIWFQSLMEYLYERSPFSIMFKKTDGDDSFSLGMGNTIYSIAAKGYGSKTEVENFFVNDYFAIQLRELVEAVRQMRAYDKPVNEIEKETGLTADIIHKIK